MAAVRTGWDALFERATTIEGIEKVALATAEAFVTERFPAPCPGWPGARHHGPDIMWAANDSNVPFLACTPVLSEFHPGVSTFTTLSVLGLCPIRTALEAEWTADFPEPQISPIPSEDFARSTQDARLAREHFHLDLGHDHTSGHPTAQVVHAADFDVEERNGRLLARHLGGGPIFDLLAIFERRIKLRAAVGFSLHGSGKAGRRGMFGPIVVQRAFRRLFPPAFTRGRYNSTTRTRCGPGKPQTAFLIGISQMPSEIQPVYVDFASDLSIDMLLSMLVDTDEVSVTEMLPRPDGLWLSDSAGQTYTSELIYPRRPSTVQWNRGVGLRLCTLALLA